MSDDDERSLEKFLRGSVWWVRGTRPDTDEYVRTSLRTSDPAVAEAKIREIYAEARKRRILGPDAPKPEDELVFSGAVLLYDAGANEKRYLLPIVRKIGNQRVKDITPQAVRKLAKDMYPNASTDTWQRQVVTPVRAVINNAHDLGRCPPIRIRAFDRDERMRQDRFRGEVSRKPRAPGSWPWLLAFCGHADPRDAALAYFMFTTGARIGQSIAMTRSEDMDLSGPRLQLPATKGHPEQWVDIDPELRTMIANLPVPYRGIARDRVFTLAGTGKNGALYARWKAACAKAGIEYLSPHEAGRHGFGTEMIVRQRVDPTSAAQEGRWSNPSVMLKTYSHPEGSKARVRDAFEAGKLAARTPGVQQKTGNRDKNMIGKGK
jgi:integrase